MEDEIGIIFAPKPYDHEAEAPGGLLGHDTCKAKRLIDARGSKKGLKDAEHVTLLTAGKECGGGGGYLYRSRR